MGAREAWGLGWDPDSGGPAALGNGRQTPPSFPTRSRLRPRFLLLHLCVFSIFHEDYIPRRRTDSLFFSSFQSSFSGYLILSLQRPCREMGPGLSSGKLAMLHVSGGGAGRADR